MTPPVPPASAAEPGGDEHGGRARVGGLPGTDERAPTGCDDVPNLNPVACRSQVGPAETDPRAELSPERPTEQDGPAERVAGVRPALGDAWRDELHARDPRARRHLRPKDRGGARTCLSQLDTSHASVRKPDHDVE